jgi:hypothetical protein
MLTSPSTLRSPTFCHIVAGLHTGAADLLEDLGFDRDYILSHIDQEPLDPFRATYHYSNFGYTAGSIAARGGGR